MLLYTCTYYSGIHVSMHVANLADKHNLPGACFLSFRPQSKQKQQEVMCSVYITLNVSGGKLCYSVE